MQIINVPLVSKWVLVATCIGLSVGASASIAQQRPGGQGRGGPPGFGSGGPLELLQRADVQGELELLDDQKEEARDLVQKFNERRRELFSGFAEQFRNRDATDEQRQALRSKVQETMQTLNKETEQGLSFLLPHQRERLSQLEVQFRMRGGGGLGALGSREIGEKLGVTEEQREALRDKSLELGQEFSKKLAELRRELQDQLLAELNPDQRAKFQAMVGDPFEFQDRPPGGGRERGQRGEGERPRRPQE
ncbi:MAG: hypothetical protein H8E66_00405 [Planctomycetes bacterium]|nr:hypothetical protein [Planctomycetota bacterium]